MGEDIRKLLEEATRPLWCSFAWYGYDSELELAKEFLAEGNFKSANAILKRLKMESIEHKCTVSLTSAKNALEKAMSSVKDKDMSGADSAIQETRKELGEVMSKILEG